LLAANPARWTPFDAEEGNRGSIPLVALLFWAWNTLRFEAFVAIAIDELDLSRLP
jgi:hypothetical protein